MSSTEEDARSSDSLSVQDIIIRENKEGSSGSDVMTARDSIFMTGMDVPDGGQKIHLATRIGGLHHIKKKVTDGMMDIALLTANANQLKFIITYNQKSPTYYLTFGMVVLSLVLQIMVGIALILRRYLKNNGTNNQLNRCSLFLVVGIFIITIVNILAACFTTTDGGGGGSPQIQQPVVVPAPLTE